MTDKATYIHEVEEQLASWKDDTYKLKIIAEDAGWEDPDRQIRYYQVIEDITAREEEVAEKLSLLKQDDTPGWHTKTHEINALRHDVEKFVSSARANVT